MAFRASLSILGLGFVEAIRKHTLEAIRRRQPLSMRGRLIEVPVLEAPGRDPDRDGLAGRTSRPACCRSRLTPT